MPSAQLGYGLQVFGPAAKSPTLKKSANLALAESLISVIFIILALAAVMIVAANFSGTAISRSSDQQEKTAYLPGQYVTQQLNGGYLGQ